MQFAEYFDLKSRSN